ncbi:MAG: hypothetical protein KGL53_10635 [Elusimicrobia bacterium]|nr:hypothetical protein [Elusimicrobiota bacterium]
MKTTLLLVAAMVTGSAAGAQVVQKPVNKPFQICLWPNPCGAASPRPPAPAPKKPAKKDEGAKSSLEAIPSDPLTRAVVDGSLAEGSGIVAAIRLTPQQTGEAKDEIITTGTGLRDALAPVGKASLPSSVVPAKKDGAKGADDGEWVKVDSKTPSAGQLNDMRSERKALGGDDLSASGAERRMWKDSK